MILLVQYVNRHAQAESRPDAEADAVLGWVRPLMTPLSLRKPSILVPFELLLQQQTRSGLNSRHDEGSQRAQGRPGQIRTTGAGRLDFRVAGVTGPKPKKLACRPASRENALPDAAEPSLIGKP